MASRRDRGEPRGFFRALIEDPWRKLGAVGLAILLWIYLDSQVSQSESLELELRCDAPSADLRNLRGKFLSLRLDTDRYTLLGFENVDEPGAALSQLTLELSGARRAMQELLANPLFVIRLAPGEPPGPALVEFGVADVQPLDPRHAGLIASMTPARVRARLARNIERNIDLKRSLIEVRGPEVPNFDDRLQWDDLSFEPKVVKVRGPDYIVNEFGRDTAAPFVFEPAPPAVDVQVLSESLRLAPWAAGVSLEPEAVIMRITLRPPTEPVKLPAVPVDLVGAQRDSFKLDRDRVDVEISAYDRLWNNLPKLPEDLRAWVEQNCLVIALLPQDVPLDSEGTIEDIRLVFRRSEIRDSDWKMTIPPTIRYLPKPRNP